MRTVRTLCAALLPLTVLSCPTQADSGAVAIAVPIRGVVLDGNLSDWSDEMPTYLVSAHSFGVEPNDKGDLQGSFRIGYDAEEGAIYIAVEVKDESAVLGPSVGPILRRSQDGCTVKVSWKRASRSYTYTLLGRDTRVAQQPSETGAMQSDVDVKVQRFEGSHVYEWRLNIEEIARGEVSIECISFHRRTMQRLCR